MAAKFIQGGINKQVSESRLLPAYYDHYTAQTPIKRRLREASLIYQLF